MCAVVLQATWDSVGRRQDGVFPVWRRYRCRSGTAIRFPASRDRTLACAPGESRDANGPRLQCNPPERPCSNAASP